MNRTWIWAAAALLVTATYCGTASAQVAYYSAPAVVAPPVVGYVPERRGLFGLRTSYRPVYGAYAAPVVAAPVTSYYAPITTNYAPITTNYAPITTNYAAPAAGVVTTNYLSPAPVTTYYGGTTLAAPTTTYYGGTTLAAPTTTYYGGTGVVSPTTTYYGPTSTFYGPTAAPATVTPTTTYYAPMEAIVVP